MTQVRTLAVAALLAGGWSCVDAAYGCEDDAQCSLAAEGQCEAVGFCSYPDADCESGRRFSRVAGSQADQCTEPGDVASDTGTTGPADTMDGGSGASGMDDTTDATTTGPGNTESSSSGPDDTTGPSTMCGDAIVDPPEACDDPEDRLGIGCTDACELAVEVVRLETYDANDGDDRYTSVAAFPGGGVVIAGYHRTGATRDALVRRLDANGDELWLADHDQAGGNDVANGVTVAPNGSVYAVGQASDGGNVAWRGRWDNNGNEGYVQLIPSQSEALAVDLTVQSTLIVAGGNFANGQAFAARYPTFDNPEDWLVDVADVDATNSSFIATSAATETQAFVTGHIDEQLVLARVDDATLDVLYTHPAQLAAPMDRGQGIARIDDLLVVAGFVTDEEATRGWLGGLDLDGALQWSTTVFLGGRTELEAVAIADDGRIVAGGLHGPGANAAFITGHDPGGAQRWRFTLPDLPNSVVRGLAFDDDGQLWVVGNTEPGDNDDAFFAILELAPE